jgi:hypothetical protein
MTVSLSINDQAVAVDADPSTPLLWVLRDHLGTNSNGRSTCVGRWPSGTRCSSTINPIESSRPLMRSGIAAPI